MKRPPLDLHPKILAAVVTFAALVAVAWFANVALGTNLGDSLTEWFVGAVLPLVSGYLKTGD